METLRPGERQRRGALGKYRVGQPPATGQFQQQGRMTQAEQTAIDGRIEFGTARAEHG